MGKTKQTSKSTKITPKTKVALGLLHQRLINRYTRSFMTGYAANVWKDIELRIDPNPLCTSGKISSKKKKIRSKNQLKQKVPFKRIFMDNILVTAPIFSDY